MFSKAQRFNSKGVGCGADAVYNPKDLDKPIGGVIPKGDRFESKSDTESLHSEKSSLLFRTADYVVLKEHAAQLGVLVWENERTRTMVVTKQGHDDIKKFWKRYSKSS